MTQPDRARIADAIAAAERATSGEIRVVLVRRSLLRGHVYPVLWASLVALLLPWLVALFRPMPLLALFAAQLVLFGGGALLLMLPGLAVCVTPRSVREEAAREMALTQFLALGIHKTRERTGVLILVAPADRVAEVVADQKIHACVGHDAWHAVCTHLIEGARAGRLADGLVAGVAETGRVLAAHFPPRPDKPNELPDHLVVV
ncbi:MAG: TPM domain-containing protein [Acetobacteraceae bacterium]|nr:TPM domain-containing protein [Acetobacteraceae bacterium]